MSKHVKQAPVNEFDKTLAASSSFIEKNKKVLGYGISGVLAVIIICVLAWQYVIIPRNIEAADNMAAAQQLYLQGQYDKALNGEGQNAGFLQIIDEYKFTPSANLAKLYAGLCYAHTQKFQEAVNYLEDYSSCGDEMVSNAAVGALGNCYAELGQTDKAVQTLVKAAEKADNNSLSPLYYLQAGQIYESMDQKDKALECYKTIKSKYPASMQAQEIDKFIEHLQ